MASLSNFWQSTIGKKVVMAVTGLIGIGFVISHVASNLSIFINPRHVDEYGHFLRTLGPLLWLARAVLLAAVVLHVVSAIQLTRRKGVARPVGYRAKEPQASSFASRWMGWGGALLFAFIVFHIADITWGVGLRGFVEGMPSRNIVASFSRPLVAIFYVIAMVSLGMHIWHGAWSSMRTLGAAKPSPTPLRRGLPIVLAVLIAGGFAAIPLAVLFGILR